MNCLDFDWQINELKVLGHFSVTVTEQEYLDITELVADKI